MNALCRAGTVLLAGAVASGCTVSVDSQGQIAREEKRFRVEGVPEVRLATFDGAIDVQSWDRAEVLVEIEKRGPTREAIDALVIESSQRGRLISVEAKPPRRESLQAFGFHLSTTARLRVSVPRRTDLALRTGDGSIRAERLTGDIELRTGDGAIRAANLEGDLVVHTGDGAIAIERAKGRLEANTGDGGVTISGQLRALKVHSGDGSIVCRAEAGTEMAEDWDLSTGDGSVSLYLPATFAAELDAHTGDGRIRSDFAPEGVSRDDRDRTTLRARIGEGGRRLRVRTGDGAITLKQH